ncbi:MAG: hypothetical protein JWM85_1082 [Acidimicrobiaceae bacterium]|nr:hypothetical protein [Acidimicrobiaceae bacterium]
MAKRFPLQGSDLAIALGALAVAIGLAAGGLALTAQGSSQSAPGTVEVTGTGTVTAAPDTLAVQIAVITTAGSAAQALNTNNREMRHVQAIFLAAGVKASDLMTTGLNVAPHYNSQGTQQGYSAEEDLTATLHAIAKSGAVIDAAESAVGNDVQIQGITFSLSSTATAMSEARVQAVQNAKQAAADFARGDGESVGPLVKISPVQTSVPEPLPFAANGAAGTARSAVPIKPGTQTVSVQVDVVFRLNS